MALVSSAVPSPRAPNARTSLQGPRVARSWKVVGGGGLSTSLALAGCAAASPRTIAVHATMPGAVLMVVQRAASVGAPLELGGAIEHCAEHVRTREDLAQPRQVL